VTGAGRPAAAAIADVRQAAAALAAAATGMPDAAWQRVVRYTGGQERTADVIIGSRLAEVHIHHVDLDIGYQPRDWPAGFVSDMLPRITRSLNERDQAMPARSTDGPGPVPGLAARRGRTVHPPSPRRP
jgi:maleylpyruvate isomerase